MWLCARPWASRKKAHPGCLFSIGTESPATCQCALFAKNHGSIMAGIFCMPVLRSALAGTETVQSQGQKFETGADESPDNPPARKLKSPFCALGLIRSCSVLRPFGPQRNPSCLGHFCGSDLAGLCPARVGNCGPRSYWLKAPPIRCNWSLEQSSLLQSDIPPR